MDITSNTTLSGTLDLAGKILNISAVISGPVIIKNAIIIANPFIQIFDTTVTLQNCKCREFSAMWYGASTANPDNYTAIQTSITNCLASNIKNLFIPAGNYHFSQSLTVAVLSNNQYIGACLNIYGEGDYWNDASKLIFTGTDLWALGFQYAKGGSVGRLTIQGQFITPVNNGLAYYSLSQADFNDTASKCKPNYSGICIDPDGSKNLGGSTALKIYDTWVTGFDVCYDVTRNWNTANADVLVFENVRCGNARIGIRSTQAQSKGCIVNNIVSWDNIHTLISIGAEGRAQAGNWILNGANVAGGCIRPFNITQKGWFSSHITGWYCENIGQVGTFTTGDTQNQPPLSINNSIFHFAYPAQAGIQTLVTANSNYVKFNNCDFRYYGQPANPVNFSGNALFEGSFFSGPVKSGAGSTFINYPTSVKTYQ